MKTLVLIGVVLYACPCAHAQFIDMSAIPDTAGIVGLKYSRASYDEDTWNERPSGASGVYKLYALFRMRNNWYFNAELPFIVAEQESQHQSGIANIYVGFHKVMKAHPETNLAFGLYIPTLGSANPVRQAIGVLSDTYTIFQYLDGITTRFNVAHNKKRTKGFFYGFEGGPDIFIPTFMGGTVEIFLHGSAKGGMAFNGFSAWAEVNAILPITSDVGIADALVSKLVLGGQLTKSRFRPGIFYGIPLRSEIREEVKGILEIKLEFLMRR